MEGDQTILEPPQSDDNHASSKAIGKRPQIFSFGQLPAPFVLAQLTTADKSYWSAGPRDEPQYASQQTLYDDLGVELLDHSFEGFNTCIFACRYSNTFTGRHELTEQMDRLGGTSTNVSVSSSHTDLVV